MPHAYLGWNRRHHAPFGRRGKQRLTAIFGARNPLVARYLTPYAWQINNTTRRFEYPWAHEQIAKLGSGLTILDIGGSLAGMQFTLARDGHQVHNIDPGMASRGRGWEVDPDFHAFLARTYRAPVRLHPSTLGDAHLPDASADVILSVSTIEHFAPADIDELVDDTRRVLRPGGHLVLTIDLFLDLRPLTARDRNWWGTNIDIAALLAAMGATLVVGNPAELYGFPEFDPVAIRERVSEFTIGERHPCLAQCVVARMSDPHQSTPDR